MLDADVCLGSLADIGSGSGKSALLLKADMYGAEIDVGYVPEADKPLSGRREHNARPHAGFGNECDFPSESTARLRMMLEPSPDGSGMPAARPLPSSVMLSESRITGLEVNGNYSG